MTVVFFTDNNYTINSRRPINLNAVTNPLELQSIHRSKTTGYVILS